MLWLVTKNKVRMCTFSTIIQGYIGNSSQYSKAIKRTQVHIDWKYRNKIILIYRCHY